MSSAFKDRIVAVLAAAGFALGVLVTALGAVPACDVPSARRSVEYARTVTPAMCIIANAFLPNESAIARACDLAEDALPFIRDLVGAHKTGVRRVLEERQGACMGGYRDAYDAEALWYLPRDAGADAPRAAAPDGAAR